MMTINDFCAKQIAFIFLGQGEKLSFRNDNLLILDKDKKIKYQITCYRIFALFIVGHFVLTSGLIQRSHKFGFPIYLMTNSLKLYESFGGQMDGNVLLRKAQYEYEGLSIGKHILSNKILVQRSVLNLQRKKDASLLNAIHLLADYNQRIHDYEGPLDGLLGYEGAAARLYFKHEFNNISWSARHPRIKPDYINATLDIGYTILFNFIDALLRLYGFDTYCGVLHRQFYMRKSLVCDIMEPFRPIIDYQIRKAINLNQCKETDFTEVNRQYLLQWKKNKDYVAFLLKAILDYKRDIFLYIQQYYRAFMKHKNPDEFPLFIIKS